MSLLAPSNATATVAANTNSVSITNLDLTTVYPGMTINFGARDRKTGDAWIVGTVTPSGTSGGTLTTLGNPTTTGLSSAPFVIDTLGFLGTDASYAAATNLALLQALLTLFGPNTILYTGDRKLALDKKSSTAIGRIVASINGASWADIDHRQLTYTPTGGSATTTQVLALRAYPDNTTPIDALLIDLATGGGDLRMASATMASAATVDLGSAPFGKVAITGSVAITSFGAGKHLSRWVHIVDGGGTLTYNSTSLILPGRANIVTQAGDTFHVTSDGASPPNWRVRYYTRADGTPLVLPALVQPAAQRPSFRNLLINGNFSINQRGFVSGATLASLAYGLDRWKSWYTNTVLSFVSNGPDTRVTIGSGGQIGQLVEDNTYPRGVPYTISWVGTSRCIIAWSSASEGNQSRTYDPVAGVGSGTFTISADAYALAVIIQAGTAELVQLEQSTVAHPYERRDDELRRCRRYFQRRNSPPLKGLVVNSSLLNRMSMPIEPPLRASPTVTLVGTLSVYDGSTTGTATAIPTNYSSAEVLETDLNYTSGPLATGRMATVYQGGGSIDLSAEL